MLANQKHMTILILKINTKISIEQITNNTKRTIKINLTNYSRTHNTTKSRKKTEFLTKNFDNKSKSVIISKISPLLRNWVRLTCVRPSCYGEPFPALASYWSQFR